MTTTDTDAIIDTSQTRRTLLKATGATIASFGLTGCSESDSSIGEDTTTEDTTTEDTTTTVGSEMPSYVPLEAKDLSYADTERVRVSVKLTESQPDIKEQEALLIGKDVVESRKGADEIAVHIFQPEGEVGAGACATVEWTKDRGYETDINRMFCEDPEW